MSESIYGPGQPYGGNSENTEDGQFPPPPPPPPPGQYPGTPYPEAQPGYQQTGQIPGTEPVSIMPVEDVSITSGFNYSWMKLRQNLGTLLLVALTYVGIALVLVLLLSTLAFSSRNSAASVFVVFLVVVLGALYLAVAQANIVRGTLRILADEKISYANFFQFERVGTVLLAGVIIGAFSGVLAFTFVAPVLLSGLTTFTYWLIVDKNYGAWDAIVGSMSIVWNNIATVVVFLIASAIAYYVGLMFFGVGILLAVPVVIIAQGWLFKTLIGQPVGKE